MHPSSARWLARLAVPAVLGVGMAANAAPGLADLRAAADHVTVAFKNGHLKVTGTDHADRIALRLRAATPKILEVDTNDDGRAEFRTRVADVKSITVAARGGDDRVRIDESAVPFNVTVPIVIDGGGGADDLQGGQSVETFYGGPGNDSIAGERGNDRAWMGSGDDVFEWDPGDGNDTIEGQAGTRDRMDFDGANIADDVDVSANGHRVKFFRNPGNVLMDLNDVEAIRFNALGGIDNVNVGDLSGTDAKLVENDLAGTSGTATGDGVADRVVVTGTGGDDSVVAAGDGARTRVSGLPAVVDVLGADPIDSLVIKTLAGNDSVDATGLLAGAPQLTADLGAGDDRLLGSSAKDVALGGPGNDFVDGNRGDDRGEMGAGDDVFQWDPGDGNDTIEGQAGTRDKLLFNGANVADDVDISANGPRVRFFRNPGNVLMDLDDVEAIRFNALGGADKVNVGDMSGTDMKLVENDLAGTPGGTGGDGASDTIVANGTPAPDWMAVAGAHGSVLLRGLPAAVAIANAEPIDALVVNGRGGFDRLDASRLVPGTIGLKFNQ